ncbi:MAG: FtsH protease activity modulator HflK [Chitinivibrionales bacterium]|nr:FtsH protease activity modulator HflK [Chitinivibrionales bacterium]
MKFQPHCSVVSRLLLFPLNLSLFMTYCILISRFLYQFFQERKQQSMNSGGSNDQLIRIFEKIRSKFKMRNQILILLIAAIIVMGWILFTGLYTVAVDEVAVIQRFGKYNRQRGPGLHFKWPDGIEKRTNVKVKQVLTEEFGLRTLRAGVNTNYAPEEQYLNESLMLTGDLNCAVVPWIVQYRKSDPVAYLFQVRDVEGTLRDMSEAVMRQVVGDRSIDEVISNRLEIADQAREKLQETLDEANAGLTIVNVELKNTTVPGPVQPSFNEVNQAEQEKEQMINEAKGDYNRVIPAAAGEAEKIVSEAEGYALDRVNKSRGDSSRYVSLHNEYARAKDVTRRRMYLETMNEIIPKLGKKYIVDSEQKNVLPLLNLGEKGGVR